ncbi:ABC transporter ATP-binding protein [Marinivivus vitaminiproducens]|uniref:ABC transporter ATP-binding protein n=1 Tax=Marinivivus vitaminiproducens TaxID=3035935 RepID=UPI00279827F5|nr:sn-glycerol-3-phosphate ABC transporter ATP-binding protein UgpC [Geminicoccaceae bacterium SCSIO 64248]
MSSPTATSAETPVLRDRPSTAGPNGAGGAPFLSLDHVEKDYGDHKVIQGVSLSAAKGEFVVFVGPSGCGKSTLLRMIAGLEDITGGDVSIDGRVVTNVEPASRQVAMVFQSYALYPHMSVFENMAFGLRMVKTPAAEIKKRVGEAARILQIEPLLERKPRQLSGGQRQRVAIGRAIVRNPKLFLFDEPLSNLDAELRTQMRVEIAKLHRDLGITMVYVTHDQIEAMTLADRIVVLRSGLVEQIGTPAELYDHPANTFVAGFIGSPKMNFLEATVGAVEAGRITVRHPTFTGGELAVERASDRARPGDTVIVGFRPEHLHLSATSPVMTLTVDLSENLGGATQIYARPAEGAVVTLLVPGRPDIGQGDTLQVGIARPHIYLFDQAGLAL